MMHQVFICHSSKDKEIAETVCASLEAQGIRCWMAPRNVLPSTLYSNAIIDAINMSQLVLLVFSEHSNRSQHVAREIERAGSKEIPILPFRIQDVPLSKNLEYFTSTSQWLDALTPPLGKHLELLIQSVERLIGKAKPRSGSELSSIQIEGKGQSSVNLTPPAPDNSPASRGSDVTPATGQAAVTRGTVAPPQACRVALLYKRNTEPEESILKILETALLAEGYSVFIDRHMSIGVEWAQEIERQVRGADAVIPLLSESSVRSEMLTFEVQIASDAARKQQGKPRLLPVRINFEGALPESLAAILNPLQYTTWSSAEDNQRLITEVLTSLKRPANTRVDPRKLEPVGGAVPLDSKFYIVRQTDDEFLSAIERRDSIVLVRGARQMGKTSLLARGLKQAREAGTKVMLTDFQSLNAAHFKSVEALYLILAELIADQLDLDALPQDDWKTERGPSVNFQRYLRREVLAPLSGPLVWGLDEVDRLFPCPFGSEVFGLFRSWHNARSLDSEGPWQKLTMVMAYATEAHLFISDLNQSPFNVGTRLALDDFTIEQVAELNRRYDSPLKNNGEVAAFYELVSGHPYLVRRGLHELTAHGTSLEEFTRQADRDEGPFGDHLRRFLMLLAQDAKLCEIVKEVLRQRPCPSTESFYRLRSSGLLAGASASEAHPRCQVYASYLSRHLL